MTNGSIILLWEEGGPGHGMLSTSNIFFRAGNIGSQYFPECLIAGTCVRQMQGTPEVDR